MKDTWKIFLEGQGPTNLKLFAGVLTQFTPSEGDLCCCIVAVLAEDHHTASAIVAIHHPGWELQALTELTALVWFKRIILDPNCPQAQALREFVIQDVEAIPINDDESTFQR